MYKRISDIIYEYRLGDWFSLLILLIGEGICFLTHGHHQLINSSPINPNPAISYPYITETFPGWLLIVLSLGIPLTIFTGFYLAHRRYKHAYSQYTNLFFAFLFNILLTILTAEIIKKFTGAPRPNFLAMTQWIPNSNGIGGSPGDGASFSEIREAYQSFVSGHAALSNASMFFLAQFLFHQLSPLSTSYLAHALLIHRVSLNEVPVVNLMPFMILPALPMFLSLWIALSRVRDYYHTTTDVLAGILLGIFYSFLTFHYLYLERRWVWLNQRPANIKNEWEFFGENTSYEGPLLSPSASPPLLGMRASSAKDDQLNSSKSKSQGENELAEMFLSPVENVA